MGQLIFGRTQDAYGTPFDNTDPAAIAAGLSSNTVQAAIIEAKEDAINNDRYPFQAQYGGNAGIGRYLEIFIGLPSYPNAPFIFPEASAIRQVSLGASAITTCTVGFFKTSNLITPVFSVSLVAQQRVLVTDLLVHFNPLDELVLRITSGSANKPFMRVWVNTTT